MCYSSSSKEGRFCDLLSQAWPQLTNMVIKERDVLRALGKGSHYFLARTTEVFTKINLVCFAQKE